MERLAVTHSAGNESQNICGDSTTIIIIIIIISHASIGADIKKEKKRKENKQEQSRPVADWTLSLRQPRAYGLLDQPLDCSQSETPLCVHAPLVLITRRCFFNNFFT